MQLKTHKNCSACEACMNICPQNAITMVEDEYGFKAPKIDETICINCGLCSKTCNKTDIMQRNKPISTFALQSKNNKILKKSSSGGMFAELAKYVLSQNGIVFGCAIEKIDEKFEIKHIYIEKEEDLYKLQGSKYVQSNVGYTYKEAKQFLEAEKQVLFSGTPCQIAGLKAYLNKDYENLLCVDLSCEGVPSQKLFNDYVQYIEENITKAPVLDFKFRNKQRFGWSTKGFTVSYKDNIKTKEKIIYQTNSSYFNLFINGGIHRNSCYNCKYVGLNRLGDITIADCWGIDLACPELLKYLKKKKGISLVLINTKKGNNFFNNIKRNIIFKNIDIDFVKKYNGPFRRPIEMDEEKQKYLEIYKNSGYEAMDAFFQNKIKNKKLYFKIKNATPEFIKNIIKKFTSKRTENMDCLLMTWGQWKNYGSILTAYALYKTIKNLGFSVKLINNHTPISYASDFNKKYVDMTDFCLSNKDFEKLNKITNTFIVGADNQLDYSALGQNTYRNLLDFSSKYSKKILISGSFGAWKWNENEEIMNNLQVLYNRFDFISTREEVSKNKMKECFDIDAEWFMDPVYFLPAEHYENFIENATKKDYKDSIMSYILYPNDEADKIISHIKNKYNLKINKFLGNNLAPYIEWDKNKKVENWLKSIRDSKYIVTDSFHCLSFAILFNKPVICIKNKCDTTRFQSVFSKFGLNYPIFTSFEDYQTNKEKLNALDFSISNKKIEENRQIIIDRIEKEIRKNNIVKTKIQNDAENQLENIKSKYYKQRDKFYKKNKYIYEYVIYPMFITLTLIRRKKTNEQK